MSDAVRAAVLVCAAAAAVQAQTVTCPPATDFRIPKAPASAPMAGALKLDQIMIEPQPPSRDSVLRSLPLLPPKEHAGEVPPCWSVASLDRRSAWEGLHLVQFDHYLSVETFVGGKVKTIRVVRYDPKLKPEQIRDEVRRVWLGVFWTAEDSIGWAEGNEWNIQASVEYEDGERTAILMDGWVHVQVEDREGKYWFIRLWPAVD